MAGPPGPPGQKVLSQFSTYRPKGVAQAKFPPTILPRAPILPVQRYQTVLLASATPPHTQYPENLFSHNDNA